MDHVYGKRRRSPIETNQNETFMFGTSSTTGIVDEKQGLLMSQAIVLKAPGTGAVVDPEAGAEEAPATGGISSSPLPSSSTTSSYSPRSSSDDSSSSTGLWAARDLRRFSQMS